MADQQAITHGRTTTSAMSVGRPLGIVAKHELREHLLERTAAHETLERRSTVSLATTPAMNHDHPVAGLLDELEDM